jgi:hypothetical protein
MAIWKSIATPIDQATSPYAVLSRYAERVGPDTDNKFVGLVTEAVREDTGQVSYALYIVVPKLRDYMYRLFEATLDNLLQPYPMTLRFFAQDPRNNQVKKCETPESLEKELISLIDSVTTQNILGHLEQLIQIKEDYSQKEEPIV